MGNLPENLPFSTMSEPEVIRKSNDAQTSPAEIPQDTSLSVEETSTIDIAHLQSELEAWKDRALRAAAELENYRRRVQRDLAQHILNAQMELLRPLIALLDNVERGLQAAREAPDIDRLREGLELIQRQFQHTLQKLDIQPILPEVGSLPDPTFHEVISAIPAPEGTQPHTIIEVVEPGYLYRGHLLRPARVITTE